MKKLLLLLFMLPIGAFAQIGDLNDVSYGDGRPDFPAHLKTGKPQYFRQHNRSGFILNDSILIPFKYEQLDTKFSDFMICREPYKLFGAINKQGETVIPFEYITLSQHAGGVVMGWKKDAGYGLMTPAGKVLVPFEYKKGIFGSDSTFAFFTPGKQWIVKYLGNGNLQTLIKDNFEDISFDQTGQRPLFTFRQDGLWGLSDFEKHILVPNAYEQIYSVLDKHVVVVRDGKMGVVDFQGKLLIPLVFETIQERLPNGLFRYGSKLSADKYRWGLVDSTGKVVLPAEYEQLQQFYHCDLMKVKKAGKYAMVDIAGKFRTPFLFSEVSAWKHLNYQKQKESSGNDHFLEQEAHGLYFVFKYQESDKTGLWHLEKGQIFPPEYDYYKIYTPDGPILVSKGDDRALFDLEGKQLIGFEYGFFGYSVAHPAFVVGKAKGKKILISVRDGKQIQDEYYDDYFTNNLSELDGYFVTKIGQFTALHAPDGHRLTPHKYHGNITRCGKLPEVEVRLPKDRKIVACALILNDTGLHFVALDNTGTEYEYTQN